MRDVGRVALYFEGSPLQRFLIRATVLACSNGLLMVKMDAYDLFRVDKRLSTACRKECLGTETYWLNTRASPSRYPISMENSAD